MKNPPYQGTLPPETLPQICLYDYVNALVLDEAGCGLIFEAPRTGGSGVQWQLLNQPLQPEEDPFTAVQTILTQKTGYQTSHWSYLGSHTIDPQLPMGTGYYFCAQGARKVTNPQHCNGSSPCTARWVPLVDIRYALMDGRISTISHTLNVSLALLTILK